MSCANEPRLSVDELQVICALVVSLTELRQAECKHLAIENVSPELFEKLIAAYIIGKYAK